MTFYISAVSNHCIKLRKDTLTKKERPRRPASLCEADIYKMDITQSGAYCSTSPQVLISQENLSTGALIQSEVIIHRPPTLLKPDDNYFSFEGYPSVDVDIQDGPNSCSNKQEQLVEDHIRLVRYIYQ